MVDVDSPSTVMTPSRCSILTAPQHSRMMAMVCKLFSLCFSLSILINSFSPTGLGVITSAHLSFPFAYCSFFNSPTFVLIEINRRANKCSHTLQTIRLQMVKFSPVLRSPPISSQLPLSLLSLGHIPLL